MAPSIVWDCLANKTKPLFVLDPMMGSGTTMVIAKEIGHYAYGGDTDPLAVMISRAWCSEFDSTDLLRTAKFVLDEANEISKHLDLNSAYPIGSDLETRDFINFWFDETNRVQLAALSKAIFRIQESVIRNLLFVAFSRLIITKKKGVSLAMDVSHSRPHRKYEKAPFTPFDKFIYSTEFIIKKAPFCSRRIPNKNHITRMDARNLSFKDNLFDIVITSPPYLNAIDYMRGHKLSLVWFGYPIKNLRSIRSTNIGSENTLSRYEEINNNEVLEKMGDYKKLDSRKMRMVANFVSDMRLTIHECKRVLKNKGKAIFVIGNSSVKGIYMKNSEALIELAYRNDFKLLSSTSRCLPENRRYLPPPNLKKSGTELRNRMREEVVLQFELNK
jgi:hypothetical protein